LNFLKEEPEMLSDLRNRTVGLVICLIAVVSLAVAMPALAAGDEKQVQVKKIVIDCEKEDCAEGHKIVRKVWTGEDGETVELGDEDIVIMKHGGPEGHMKKIVVECEGDDCAEGHKIIRKVWTGEDGETMELGDEDIFIMKGAHHGEHMMDLHKLHGKGGFLGVGLTEMTPELRAHFGVPEDAGVMVSKVMGESAALKAGIQVGDIISGVDGESVGSAGALAKAVGAREAGETVNLELWREGFVQNVAATLEARGAGEGMEKRHVMIFCEEGEDCEGAHELPDLSQYDCGDEEPCEVKVECKEEGCECTVNGQSADCALFPGLPKPSE